MAQRPPKASHVGASALMVLAAKGRDADILALLTSGADASLKSRNGMQAADWAQKFGHTKSAELIQEHLVVRRFHQFAHIPCQRMLSSSKNLHSFWVPAIVALLPQSAGLEAVTHIHWVVLSPA